jgi:hypothetical protein
MWQADRQLLVGVAIALEYVGFFIYFAATKEPTPMKTFTRTSTGRGPFENLIGQEGTSLLYGGMLLAAVYLGKYWLCLSPFTKYEKIRWYLLMMVASLPYIWLLVAHDWYDPMARDMFCWVGTPLAVLFVPTVSFLVEVASNQRPSNLLGVRYALEIIVLCPIWVVVWSFLAFLLWV